MAFKQVPLSSIVANPFRNLEKYPLDPAKVKRLRSSIARTDFWENVVARERDGKFELAYGHHRIQAARDEFGSGASVNILVKDLDDAHMLQMMAADNDDTVVNPVFYLEVVEAAAGFLGRQITGKSISKSKHDRAMFRGLAYNLSRRGEGGFNFKVATFLGWGLGRVTQALAALAAIRSGHVAPGVIRIITESNAASKFVYALRKAGANGHPVPFAKQLEMARKIQASSNKMIAAKVVAAEYLHPEIAETTDRLTYLLREASSRAHALDVALSHLKHYKEPLHSKAYRHSLEAVNLAASLKGVVALTQEVFSRPKLSERKAPVLGAKEEHNVVVQK
jgi:hypothetical protein